MEAKLRSGLSSFLNGDVNVVMQCVHDTFARYLHTSDFGVRGGLTEASLKVSLLSVIHMMLLQNGLVDNDKIVLQSELYLSDLTKRRFADVAVQSPCGTVLVELKYVPPRYRQGQSVPCFSRTQLQKAVSDCAKLSASQFLQQRVTTGAKTPDGSGLDVMSISDLLRQAQQQVGEYAALLYKTQPSCRMKPIHCVAAVALGSRLTWTSAAFVAPIAGATCTLASGAGAGISSASTSALMQASGLAVSTSTTVCAVPPAHPLTSSTTLAKPPAIAKTPLACGEKKEDGMQDL